MGAASTSCFGLSVDEYDFAKRLRAGGEESIGGGRLIHSIAGADHWFDAMSRDCAYGIGKTGNWTGEVTITVAPDAFASCSAITLTPPVPRRATLESGRTSAARNALHAVVPAIGNAAASANSKCSGMGTTLRSGTAT